MRKLAPLLILLLTGLAGVADAAMHSGPGVLGRHHRLGGSGGVLIGNGIQASLDFRFTTGGYYQQGQAAADISLMTVARASGKSCDDNAGNYTTVGNNVLCATNKGALIEETRTNGIRNNSMQGAVPGTPGTLPSFWLETHNTGIVPAVVGTGTEGGINYVDIQLVGTATAGNNNLYLEDTSGAIVATNGQTWTSSVYLRLVSGNATMFSTVIMGVSQRNGGAGIGDLNFQIPVPTNAPLGSQRLTQTVTTNQATITSVIPVIQLNPTVGPVNVTVRIGWPQLEQGAFVTSPIRTTNAAVTRAADVVTVTTPPTFGSAYTLFAQGTPNALPTFGTNQAVFGINDGTGNNWTHVGRASATGNYLVGLVVGGVSQGVPALVGVWGQGSSSKIGFALAAGDQAISINGGAPTTSATTPIFAPSVVTVGTRQGGGLPWNGYLERIALWPTTRLPNATLQSLTQ